ncbi:hypothetical protein D187_005515 [Cystobacter fuscus DSM 2262]|uniref:Uncharacterized protein n=1 Tax=Cystobacter fuscus (strain ATCC 25194 / DSM 2262 / NBRC 100088 / M29) TaxID=1242864 RepID=S9PMX3_CYSF2|nr:hypothetical protein [Cystobacter fuscus]EPX64381.1 hypothetical protein D187_005515 [Cystobacter fuscus DSM 2262]
MGWIRERMEQLEPPSTSVSELAQRVRKAHAWPRGKKLKATSLATYLGKFDEGQSLEWLDQHPEVSRALAEALEMAPEELNEQLAELQANKLAPGAKLRLRDVQTRPLDLRHEPLPPGIRMEVQDPAFWPLWWYAPSGSGRTLVGQWLQARGLAVFIQARTWAEAEQQLPANGHPVFVELDSAEEAPDWEQRWEEWKICVATESLPSAPPENRPEEDEERLFRKPPPNWRLVKNASAPEWIDDFLEWLEERVTVKRFDARAFRQWLSQSTILNRIDNVGTALGLAGLFATYGRKDGTGPLAKTQDLSEMAKLFLRMLIQHRENEVDLPVPKLWERLSYLSHSLLQDGSAPSHEARTLDAWHALVRVRPDRVDLEWLETLAENGLKVDKAHLDKARTQLPADAFRTVKALRSLGLLRERQPGQYAFRPPWVLEALLQHSLLELLGQGPEAWGGVLLRQEHAVTVFKELFERCRRKDFTLVEQLLARPAPTAPAWVAGLEAAFRALGFASLLGVQIPEDLRWNILRHQRALTIPTHDGIPLPRITYAHKSEQEEPLLDRGLWYTALLSLTEALPPRSELSIEDWCATMSEQTRIWLLDMAACRTAQEKGARSTDWWLPLLELGGRLMNRLHLFNDSASRIPELAQPEYLLRRLQSKDLTLSELEGYFTWRELGIVLPDYVRRRGLEWERLARRIWDIWLKERHDKQLPQFLAPVAPHAQLLWTTLPAAVVEVFVEDRHYHSMFRQESMFPFFQREHWNVFLRGWTGSGGISRSKTGYSQLTALQMMPEEHVRQAIRAGYPDAYDHSSRRLLWRRWPEVLCEEVERLLQQGHWETALHQAWAAPAHLVARLLVSAEQGMAQSSAPPPPMVARWLHGQIAERVPGWDKAWVLLERLMPSTAS